MGLLRQVDADFAREVALAIGVTVEPPDAEAPRTRAPDLARGRSIASAPSLSLSNSPRGSIRTRKIAALVTAGVRRDELDVVTAALCAAGAHVEVIGEALGQVRSAEGQPVAIDHPFANTASVFYDAVYVPGGAASVERLSARAPALRFVREAFAHAKAIGATSEGVLLLRAAGLAIAESEGSRLTDERGVVVAGMGQAEAFVIQWIEAIKEHRHFDREGEAPTR